MKLPNCWAVVCGICGLLVTLTPASPAQTFTTLATLTSDQGSFPFSALIQGRNGDLYGTALNGGANGFGTVFGVTPVGIVVTLYDFCAQSGCADGAYPVGALVLGIDGNFYGTTQNGGAAGLGTVFKLTSTGTLTVLHSFEAAEGSFPDAGLVLGSDGNFYGTTSYGGSSSFCPCGTVFMITPAGAVTTLHSFAFSDGEAPVAPLILGTDGSFYGTTTRGGLSSSCSQGCGTVFKITTSGQFTSLHSFDYAGGQDPVAPLVQPSNGGLYGTTFSGGATNSHGCTGGCGTIFRIAPSGTFATVHKFHVTDGGSPESGLTQGSDGRLYGETPIGGFGEIFDLTLPATLTTLYSFTAATGGGGNAGLVQSTDGKFYGTYGDPGAVFGLDTGLGPFVTFVIPTGKAGKTAQILGQGLTGATGVTFNGTAATKLSVVSDTYMTAVVPVGATTGKVVITTPSGTLTSNVDFRISK